MKKILFRTFVLLVAVLPAAGCIEETFPVGSTVTESPVSGTDDPLTKQVGAITAALHAFNTANYYSTYGEHTDFGLPSIHIMTESMLEDMVPCGNANYSHYTAYSSNQAQGDVYIYCAYFWECYYWGRNNLWRKFKWIRLYLSQHSFLSGYCNGKYEFYY